MQRKRNDEKNKFIEKPFFSACLHCRYTPLVAFLKNCPKPFHWLSFSTIGSAARLKKIDYPGINNYSQFSFDGLGRNVRLVEVTSGITSATRQFVYARANRQEERDASGALVSSFFIRGQKTSGTSYFYSSDHIGSVRELCDASGTLCGDYDYDCFGRQTAFIQTNSSDYGYASYFFHQRSNMSVTETRPYDAKLGRFLRRDTILERGGTNLYAYVWNSPTNFLDPEGTSATSGISSAISAMSGGKKDDGKKEDKNQKKQTLPDCEECCKQILDQKETLIYCRTNLSDEAIALYWDCKFGCLKDPNSCWNPKNGPREGSSDDGGGGGSGSGSAGGAPPPPNKKKKKCDKDCDKE